MREIAILRQLWFLCLTAHQDVTHVSDMTWPFMS
jgi:hypothetical protein